MFKCSMGSGQGPQGKLEGLFVGSFNNCFGKFVPFFKGAVSWQSSSLCLTSIANDSPSIAMELKLTAKKLHGNDKIRDLRQTNMSPEHYF